MLKCMFSLLKNFMICKTVSGSFEIKSKDVIRFQIIYLIFFQKVVKYSFLYVIKNIRQYKVEKLSFQKFHYNIKYQASKIIVCFYSTKFTIWVFESIIECNFQRSFHSRNTEDAISIFVFRKIILILKFY